jgi:hypothetical protein
MGAVLPSHQAGTDEILACAGARRTGPHPLVREAARITRAALAEGAERATFCWLSESDMGRADTQLGDEAMRLLGEVSLLLNLIYCAEPWSEHEWRLLSTASHLPSCIRRPASREQYMTSGCPRDCGFGLCPYPGPHAARGAGASCRRRSARPNVTSRNGSGPRRGTKAAQRRPR